MEEQKLSQDLYENEIDIEGLKTFLNSSGNELLKRRMTQTDSKERGQAYTSFVNGFINAAHPANFEAKNKVTQIAVNIANIFREFFLSKNEYKLRALVSHHADEVIENNNQNTQKVIETIERRTQPIDQIEKMAKEGNFKGISRHLEQAINIASDYHPVRGYCFTDVNGILKSVPKNEAIARLKPPNIIAKVTAEMDGRQITDVDPQLFQRADNHQKMIHFTILDAIKLLGNEEDPIQREADELIGKTFTRIPTPFPPGIHTRLVINGATYLEDLFIRAYEKLDDGTLLVDNREQIDCGIRFSFELNKEKGMNFSYIFKPDSTNKDKELFYRIAKALQQDGEFKVLSDDKTVLGGQYKGRVYDSGFSSVDKAIDFFERLSVIDDFYDTTINVIGNVFLKDMQNIIELSDLITGKVYKKEWQGEVEFTGSVSDYTRELANNLAAPITSVAPTCRELKIFEDVYRIHVKQAYTNVVVVEAERWAKKIKALDIGDPVKVKMISTETSEVAEWIDAEAYNAEYERQHSAAITIKL